MVALRSQGNWRWEGPLGTLLGLVHWKRASSPVEAGTAGLGIELASLTSPALADVFFTTNASWEAPGCVCLR